MAVIAFVAPFIPVEIEVLAYSACKSNRQLAKDISIILLS